MAKTVDPLRHVKKRHWLWAVISSWQVGDVVVEQPLTPEVLATPYNERVLWWYYFRINREYYDVRMVDSSLFLDPAGNEISTVAQRIIHQLTQWSAPEGIEIEAIVGNEMSYGSDPHKPIYVYEPEHGISALDMMCQVHGVESLKAYKDHQVALSASC